MRLYARCRSLIRRLLRGEDISRIHLSKDQWERQFTEGTWDRLVDDQPNTMALMQLIENSLQGRTHARVLDVGCGNGALALQIQARSLPVYYVGIDLAEAAIAEAKLRVPTFEFRVQDAEYPPADIGSYDVLVFNEVLYYVDTARVLARYVASVRPEASIMISIYRSPRSWLLWKRIASVVRITHRERVRATAGRTQWDIAVGAAKQGGAEGE